MKISKDEYQLPEYVCDDIEQLARKTGVSSGTIRSEMSKYKHKKKKTTRFMVVEVDEEEDT